MAGGGRGSSTGVHGKARGSIFHREHGTSPLLRQATLTGTHLQRQATFAADLANLDNAQTDSKPRPKSFFQKGERDRENETVESMTSGSQRWVILPDGNFRVTWDLLIMSLVLYYAILTPIRSCFTVPTASEDVFQALEVVFNICFLADIAFNFCTAFRYRSGPNQGILETRHPVIVRTYLQSWFWVDLVASFPIDFVLPGSNTLVSPTRRLYACRS